MNDILKQILNKKWQFFKYKTYFVSLNQQVRSWPSSWIRIRCLLVKNIWKKWRFIFVMHVTNFDRAWNILWMNTGNSQHSFVVFVNFIILHSWNKNIFDYTKNIKFLSGQVKPCITKSFQTYISPKLKVFCSLNPFIGVHRIFLRG